MNEKCRDGTEVTVWYARTDAVRDPELVARCESLLVDDEPGRLTAFVFERHRHEYLVTRALARGVLARCLAVAPPAVEYRRNAYGRPELHPANELRFNLTNTTALVACGIATGREIGIDAEPLTRGDDILALSDTVFTLRERAALLALDAEARRRRAVDLWTLKEAYMKARGMGMSIPVQGFGIEIDGQAIRVDVRERGDDDGDRWLLSTRIIEGHVLGTCVERKTESDMRVRLVHADIAALLC